MHRRRFLALGSLSLLAACDVRRQLLMASGWSGAFVMPEPEEPIIPGIATLTSDPEGGWVWFGSPNAIRNGDDTIVGYIRDGGTGGDVRAVLVDNATQTVTSTTMIYDNFLDDDHEPPSFVVRPDGIIMAALAYHVGDIYCAIGTSPGVIPAQAQLTNITSQVGSLSGAAGYTYASILYLDDEDRYYIFFRYHDTSSIGHVGYTYSDDDGTTWSARTLVQQITYHHVIKNGTDRLDLVLSDHPLYGQGDDPDARTSIYHAYYESGTGWHKSDGTGLTPLIGNAAATVVYDGSSERAWLWSIAIDDSGHPRIAFVIYEETFPSGPWRYAYARWSGSAWVVNDDVADAGGAIAPSAAPEHGNNYAGGIAIDPEDPDRILFSSDAGGDFQIYYGVTADSGATWTITALTSDSDKNVRPVWVRGHGDEVQAVCLYGTYTDYFNYDQGIKVIGTV